MDSFLIEAKQLFFEKNRKKVSSLYIQIQKKSSFFDKPDHIELAYYLLKSIKDSSAIFYLEEMYHITTYLLKQFSIDGMNYKLKEDNKRILIEGFAVLLNLFLRDGTNGNNLFSFYTQDKKEINLKKNKILVIDDDPIFYEWLKENIANTGIYIDIHHPQNIVSYIIKEKINMVFINTIIENIKSLDIIKQIRSHPWTASVPIIGVTYKYDKKQDISLLNAGISRSIQKPFSEALFLAVINNLSYTQNLLSNKDNTILHQREEIVELINKEWVRFQRSNAFFSILLIKIDLLDHLIDTHGMEQMLDYLSNLYLAIDQSIRTYDEVKRWSEDALIILLPATRIDDAYMVGNRIRALAHQLIDERSISKNVLISVIESDIGYNQPLEMVKRLEKDIISTIDINKIPPLSDRDDKIMDQTRIKKVLIIDDDPTPSTILENHLNPDEWEIEIVLDRSLSLEKALEYKPDFIISETRINDFDGYTFCYQIRQLPLLRETIFFFLSRQTLSSNIVRGLKTGADDYITKPFSPDEVEARMRREWKKKVIKREA